MKVIKLLRTFALVSLLHVIGSLASHFVHSDIRSWIDVYIRDAKIVLHNPSLPFEQRKEYFTRLVHYLQSDEISQHCPGFDQQIKKQTLQKMDETAFAISTLALENIPTILDQVQTCLKETAPTPTHKPGPARGGAFEQAALEDLRIVQQEAVDDALKYLETICGHSIALKNSIQRKASYSDRDLTLTAQDAIQVTKNIIQMLADQTLIDRDQPEINAYDQKFGTILTNKKNVNAKREELMQALESLYADLKIKIFKKINEPNINVKIPESCQQKQITFWD